MSQIDKAKTYKYFPKEIIYNFDTFHPYNTYLEVSINGGTPKSSILNGMSHINHPFWGTPIYGNTHMYL